MWYYDKIIINKISTISQRLQVKKYIYYERNFERKMTWQICIFFIELAFIKCK